MCKCGWHENIVPYPSASKPEPKSLTFDEALACEKVRIALPWFSGLPILYESRDGYYREHDILMIDLADRKGYKITEKVD